MELEEGQIVLCTVDKIAGTTVFVRLEDGKEGTIVTSEISSGRIRNIRDYVVPNKKIACKILRISKEHIDLSLRRVTAKEKKETLEAHKREKSLIATLKTISENPEKIINKIKEKSTLSEFFREAKENPKLLEKLMSKEEANKLIKILKEKKEKEVSVKKRISLQSQAENGLIVIKKILPEQASYIAAGRFLITVKAQNYKEANAKMNEILEKLEKEADKENCEFSVGR